MRHTSMLIAAGLVFMILSRSAGAEAPLPLEVRFAYEDAEYGVTGSYEIGADPEDAVVYVTQKLSGATAQAQVEDVRVSHRGWRIEVEAHAFFGPASTTNGIIPILIVTIDDRLQASGSFTREGSLIARSARVEGSINCRACGSIEVTVSD